MPYNVSLFDLTTFSLPALGLYKYRMHLKSSTRETSISKNDIQKENSSLFRIKRLHATRCTGLNTFNISLTLTKLRNHSQ